MRVFLLGLTDVGLRQYLVHSKGSVLFHFARTMWQTISPRYGEDGWWYAVREEIAYLECDVCEERILEGQFEQKACNDTDHQTCQACKNERRQTPSESLTEGNSSGRKGGRQACTEF